MSRKYVWLSATLLLALALLLPGCFDYDLKLVLKKNLEGSYTVTLEVPEGLAMQFPKGPEDIVNPEPVSSRQPAGPGVLRLEQSADFGSLDRLIARRARFTLERVDLGLLGMRNDTFRLTGWLRSLEGDRPDRDQPVGTEMDDRLPRGAKPPRPSDPDTARAQELLTASLAGRFLSMTWVLPGKIVETWGLNIGGQRVEPVVDAEKGRVTWRIPLALLAMAQVRHTLVFRADFTADLKFKAENIHSAASTWTAEKLLPGQAMKQREAEQKRLEQEEREKAAQEAKQQ